jgi:hypothetical protein
MLNNRLHAYFQTHWDREWYEPFPLYQQRLAEVVKAILTQLDAPNSPLPRFTLDGQTALLTDVQPLLTPAENDALNRHLATGKLHIGPWFVMPDTVLVGAESLIRNLQLGIKTANAYGCTDFTGYLPDTFGQPSSLPTLFQGMGIETAIVWRGRGMAGQPSAFFQWESPNGHRVLTYQLAEGYFHLLLHDETLSTTEKLVELDSLIHKLGRFSSTNEPFLLPLGGDHLGTPKTEALKAFHQHLPTAKVVHPHQFMQTAQAWLAETKPEISTHNGSLRAVGSTQNDAPFLLTGTLSARMNLKLANAKLEHRLTHQTERQLAWVAMAQPEKLPAGWAFSLGKAWENLLLNHPHDSICGCSLDAVHRTNHARFDDANAYAEGLERRTQQALGLNQAGIHGWNGSTVAVSGVVPISVTIDRKSADETEETVLTRLAKALPDAQFHTIDGGLVDAYKTDFRQVPLSHLTHWQATGWMTITQENALPPLSVVNKYPHPNPLPEVEGTLAGDALRGVPNHQYETPFFTIEWTEQSFKVMLPHPSPLPKGEGTTLQLPTYRVKADVGDSYNRQPSIDALPFMLHQVAVDYQTPNATQWQLYYQTAEGDALTQTILCVADEPVLTITTEFTPNRPFIAVEMVLAEADFPQSIKGYQHLGWEEHRFTPEGLVARQQAFPVQNPADEWEALGGIFQAGLQTPSHYLWQAGCYAYEVEESAVIVPLHRGFGVLSGGKMPVRGCPAGPPFETPEGQGVGETLRFAGLWGNASVLNEQLPLLKKAKAMLLGDVGLKGKILENELARGASPTEAKRLQLWTVETPLPVAIELQACYPKPIESQGDGVVFRWLNPTDKPMFLPLPKNQSIWLCTLKDEPLWQLESATEVWEITPFNWLTLWMTA